MHKCIFGQAYCQDLLRRILMKFISYFSEPYCIFYIFLKFIQFFGIIKENENQKPMHSVGLDSAQGLALLARPNGYFGMADPATRRGRDARSAVTASTATAVARLGRAHRRILGDDVGAVSTTVRRATHRARLRGWGLTEAVDQR
jgi:hypothetical protein